MAGECEMKNRADITLLFIFALFLRRNIMKTFIKDFFCIVK